MTGDGSDYGEFREQAMTDPETVKTEPTLADRLKDIAAAEQSGWRAARILEAANHITAQEEELRNLRQMNQTTRELLAGSHNRRTAQEDIIRELRGVTDAAKEYGTNGHARWCGGVPGMGGECDCGFRALSEALQAARHALNSSDAEGDE